MKIFAAIIAMAVAATAASSPAARHTSLRRARTSAMATATPNPNCAPDSLCADWVARYNAEGLSDHAVGIVTSPDGARVYVTGVSTSASSGLDFATVAYDANTGAQIWLSRYNGPANGNDMPYSFGTGRQIAISGDGKTIFVTGLSAKSNGFNDYVTIAYRTSDGAELWVSRYSTPRDSIGASLALSGDGQRLYVTGYSSLAVAVPPAPPAENYDYVTIGYDTSNGNQLWLARYDGPARFWDVAYAIGVANVREPDGSRREEVFVTGRSNGASAGNADADFATVAYDGLTGAQLWVTRYNGPANDRDLAYGLAASPDGSLVCVTGESAGIGTDSDYATVCYDSITGAQKWSGRYDNGSQDLPLDIAFNPTGDRVAVTGFSVNPIGGVGFTPVRDAATVVYVATTGASIWTSRHGEADGAAASRISYSHDGRRLYIAGLENGNVVALGNGGIGLQAGHSPSLTVAYDAGNGAEMWATHYSGPAGDEGAYGLAVSPDDAHVYIAGGGQSQAGDFSTLSFASGALTGAGLTSEWISPLGLTPQPRLDAQMIYDPVRQRTVLFGGAVGGGGLSGLNNETWLLGDANWRQAGPQHFPFGREAAGIAYDSARQQLVLFGGYTSSSIQFGDTNDTWVWDGNDWTQLASSPTATLPPIRDSAAMAFFPDAGVTILFGGESLSNGQTNILNDTWAWNGSGWTQLQPASSPPARFGAVMVYDAARHKLVLFGGATDDDTWTYDGSTWAKENPAVHPSTRSYATGTYDSDRNVVLLYGGTDASGKALGDTWTWDGSTWTQQQPAHPPGARSDAVMAYDAAQHRAILFAGGNADTTFGDTWTWNGNDWISLGQATQPSPRIAPAMTYDPRHDQTILFGGLPSLGIFNDTWLWNGNSWRQLNPANVPPARGYTSLVDDPAIGRVILFGGFGPGAVLNDTWSWDGTDWIQYQPAHAPPARTNAQLAFDGAHLLLYGGFDGHGAVFSDTWTFDGNDWTQRSPATSPPPINGAAMAYDPARHQVVLFGGSSGNVLDLPASASVPLDQTWTWDGATWTQQNPAHHPPAIAGHSMAYDPMLGGVVLFNGGQSVAGGADVLGPKGLFNNELWLWNGSDWTQITTPTVPGPRGFEGLACDTQRKSLVLFGGNGVHGVQGDTWTFAPPSAQLLGIKSRKVHGTAGAFDVDLRLSGKPGIECRSGGGNGDYEMVFAFANALTSVADVNVSVGTATIKSHAVGNDPREYIVDLTGVTNAQTIAVTLSNIYDVNGNRSATLDGTMAVLLGDTNGDGWVNSADIAQTKSQSGQSITKNNFREDLTVDGDLNSADISLAKSKSGTALPR